MFGFYIKKAFFDGWDNFLQLVIHNIIYLVLVLLEVASLSYLGENLALLLGASAVILLLFAICQGGTASVVYNWSDYKSETWKVFIKGIGRNIGHSLFFFMLMLLEFIVLTLIIPFYLSFESVIGIILAVVMVWLFIFLVLTMPFYFPLMNLLPGDGPLKTFKKCFIIVGDNLGYTLLLLLHSVVDIVFTVLLMGLLPGWTGLMLGAQDMMKLIMKKYDWLDDNPGKTKKDLDWSEILYEEKENLGPRSFKNMIFPWK